MGECACVICQHRQPVVGNVCDRCRDRISQQLDLLGMRLGDLQREIVPGSGPAPGDRVSTSRVGSPTPARLDALSLNGPGAVDVRAGFHPAIRRWQTRHTVTVTSVVAGQPVSAERTITTWHQELVRDEHGRAVLLPDQDQVGLIPPAQWLAEQVRTWRALFGHTGPMPTTAAPAPRARVDVVRAAADPAQAPVVAVLAAAARQVRHSAVRTVLGMSDGHGGLLPADARPVDPLAEEWEIRFGALPRDEATPANLVYLKRWLNEACVRHPDIVDFAAELRAVTAELARVVGDQPDEQWIGRCPAEVVDHDTGTARACGASLWQDPFVGMHVAGQFVGGQVVCPRCHSAWGPRRVELLHLAFEIRRVWPVDRRRRYTSAEIAQLNSPVLRCPACTSPVEVAWQEVTGAGDEVRWWRPGKPVCPNGCPEAERLI